MTVFGWAWLVWIVATVTTFAVIEGVALARKNRGDGQRDTLTSHIQGLTRVRWVRDVAAGLLVGFVGWFVFHLWVA